MNDLMKPDFSIAVVDDDESVRESLESLLKSLGFHVSTFESAEAFLVAGELRAAGCVILDVRLGSMSGLDLHRTMLTMDGTPPVVFITAHGNEVLRQKVMADGAIDCLFKPFSEEKLIAAVEKAAAAWEVSREIAPR